MAKYLGLEQARAPFRESAALAVRAEQVVKAVEALVALKDEVDHRILKHLFKELYSLVTDYPNKHAIRFRSKAVVEGRGPVIHEHVVPRRWITSAVLRSGNANGVGELLVACLVTEEEHDALGKFDREVPEEPSVDLGWSRYRRPGRAIDVYDMMGPAGEATRPDWITPFPHDGQNDGHSRSETSSSDVASSTHLVPIEHLSQSRGLNPNEGSILPDSTDGDDLNPHFHPASALKEMVRGDLSKKVKGADQ